MRNLDSKNFGMGSRDAGRSGLHACREIYQSGESVNTNAERFSQFTKDIRSEEGIKDLRHVTQETVIAYAERLNDRIEAGTMAISTAHNYVSAVNQIMEFLRQDKEVSVSTANETQIPSRTGIATEDKSNSTEDYQSVKEQLPEPLSASFELQKEFGLRFEESVKIDAIKAFEEAKETNQVTISDGTKGGQDRTVPISSESQIEALERASNIQIEMNHHSLIPPDQTYNNYQSESYRELANAREENTTFHGNRHEYAHERYEEKTGVQSPVVAGIEHGKEHIEHIASEKEITFAQAKELDQQARLEISKELGHHRMEITNAYLG
jgi:hypothetical protein